MILRNLVKLPCPKVAFLRIVFLGILVFNLQASQIMSRFFLISRILILCLWLSYGEWYHPPDAMSKRADAILTFLVKGLKSSHPFSRTSLVRELQQPTWLVTKMQVLSTKSKTLNQNWFGFTDLKQP